MRRTHGLATGLLASAAGCADPCALPLEPHPAPALAMVASDYASTEVIVFDEHGLGTLWVTSGLREAGLVAALSGDVVLPSRDSVAGTLTLLDRTPTDVLTGIPFASPGAAWQVDVRGIRASGASPNPQDLVVLDETHVLVSRFAPTPGSPEPLAAGNDLVIIDLGRRRAITRIELGADALEPDGTPVYARPSRMAWLDAARRHLLVGLARLGPLETRRTGTGAVAHVDLATQAVDVLDLDGLSNCGAVDARDGVGFVLCRGDAFSDDESRGGIVRVHLEGTRLVETSRSTVRDDGIPPPSSGLIALPEARIVYVAHGNLDPEMPDRLIAMGPTGEISELHRSAPFTLGEGVLHAGTSRGATVVVPDAEGGVLLRFDARSLTGLEAWLPPPCSRLPPRQVASFAADR